MPAEAVDKKVEEPNTPASATAANTNEDKREEIVCKPCEVENADDTSSAAAAFRASACLGAKYGCYGAIAKKFEVKATVAELLPKLKLPIGALTRLPDWEEVEVPSEFDILDVHSKIVNFSCGSRISKIKLKDGLVTFMLSKIAVPCAPHCISQAQRALAESQRDHIVPGESASSSSIHNVQFERNELLRATKRPPPVILRSGEEKDPVEVLVDILRQNPKLVAPILRKTVSDRSALTLKNYDFTARMAWLALQQYGEERKKLRASQGGTSLKKNVANEVFGCLARCEIWLKLWW